MQMSAAAKERKAAEKIRAEEEIAAKEEADKQEVVRIAGLLQRFYTEREIVYGEGHCTKVAMRIKPVEIERLLMMKYGASPDLMAAQRAEAKAKKTAEEQAKREAEQKVEEAENGKTFDVNRVPGGQQGLRIPAVPRNRNGGDWCGDCKG